MVHRAVERGSRVAEAVTEAECLIPDPIQGQEKRLDPTRGGDRHAARGARSFRHAGAAHLARRAQRRNVMLSVSRRVASPGTYLVVVSVRTRQHKQQVTVYVSGAATRTGARLRQATVLNYALTLEQAPTKLVARAVSPTPGVRLAMTVRAKSSSPPPSPTPPQPAPSPPPPSSPGPQYPNPYTTSCGLTTSPAAPQRAQLLELEHPQRPRKLRRRDQHEHEQLVERRAHRQHQLAITAQQSGSSYTSAAIETNPITSFPYGAVEANIKLPPDRGSALRSGGRRRLELAPRREIDILEAPSFNSTDDRYFDLHGPWTQQTRTAATKATSPLHQRSATVDELPHLRDHLEPQPDRLDDRRRRIRTGHARQPRPAGTVVSTTTSHGRSSSTSRSAAGRAPASPLLAERTIPAQMLVNWVRVYH